MTFELFTEDDGVSDLSNKRVAKKFSEVIDGEAMFNFGVDTLTLCGFINLAALRDDPRIV